ncbi:hypothetical protein [Gordonia sp. NPDC003950]
MTAPQRVTRRTVIAAAPDRVWERVASMDGINAELMPYLRMVLPRRHRGKTIADVEPGVRIGKVWLLYGGFLPLDYDDLTIAELRPGIGFRERSSMLTMTSWRHDRTLTPISPSSPDSPEATEVLDEVAFLPRLPLRPLSPVLRWFVGHLFRHRHARLSAQFA